MADELTPIDLLHDEVVVLRRDVNIREIRMRQAEARQEAAEAELDALRAENERLREEAEARQEVLVLRDEEIERLRAALEENGRLRADLAAGEDR